eukprot:3828511-Pleurochrysis_carterae.AAC.1
MVVVGDPVVALGLSLGVHEGRLRCPEGKRELMRAAIAEHRDEAMQRARVHWRRARALVGLLANVAQVLPELRRVLRGGYAVAQPPRGGACRLAQAWRRLRKGGRAESDWLQLLEAEDDLLRTNEGVALAPQRTFPQPDDNEVW